MLGFISMGFSRKIKYFLVHQLHYSNKEAQVLIENGAVDIAGYQVFENCLINDSDEIKINGETVRPEKKMVYLKFNKPPEFESTLNLKIEANISGFFKEYNNLSIAGRLDKASQGLLLLSNDGQWVEKLCNPKFEKEKEYLVTLNKPVDLAFIESFKGGVDIGNYITQPCQCSVVTGAVINVVLKEGKNRQIRRMCKTLGYSVLDLKRIRIANVNLKHLSTGIVESISPEEITII